METLAVLLIILFLALLASIFGINLVFRLLTERVPYVSSNAATIRLLLDNLKIPENAVFYDLGCGDGRILAAVKKRFPTVTTIGYERAWLPLVLGWLRFSKRGVELRNDDFFSADLRDATVVFCYLLPSMMARFSNVAKTMFKPGTQIVAHDFPLPGWTPIRVVRSEPHAKERTVLFFYQA